MVRRPRACPWPAAGPGCVGGHGWRRGKMGVERGPWRSGHPPPGSGPLFSTRDERRTNRGTRDPHRLSSRIPASPQAPRFPFGQRGRTARAPPQWREREPAVPTPLRGRGREPPFQSPVLGSAALEGVRSPYPAPVYEPGVGLSTTPSVAGQGGRRRSLDPRAV